MKDLINCVVLDDDKMHASATKQLVERVDFLNLIATCTDVVEATKIISSNKVDLLFLDVEMPDMSGFEFLKMINERPKVIITSGHEGYALTSYDFDVVDYLLKPFDFPRFLKAVMKAREEIGATTVNAESTGEGRDFIFLKTSSNIVKIKLEDILYVEALGDYMKVVTYEDAYVTHSTMKRLANILPREKFQRAHRSFVVNIDKIKKIQDETILVEKSTLPIGKSYKAALFNKLKII